MTKITIPIDSAKGPSGTLFDLANNVSILFDQIKKEPIDDTFFVMDDEGASPLQKLVVDQINILAILAETGGEIEDYLFGIRGPISAANDVVPVGVPLRKNILGDVKVFKDWFLPGAEVWTNNTLNEIIYYNNPNPSGSPNLKASEAEIIRQLDIATYSFMTVAEVQAEVILAGWNKL